VSQDDLYRDAVAQFRPALDRLTRAYEADFDKRRDLFQEIHLALWRSFAQFEGRCSLRTWVYRIAHNTATSHVIRQRRSNSRVLLSLEEIESIADENDHEKLSAERLAIERLLGLIRRLKPLDRQLMFLYLEGMDAASIGEITGASSGNVRVQIHRIKTLLARRFNKGRAE
jgi:RNA polymerase sigma-70 factor (ECF subfamily)